MSVMHDDLCKREKKQHLMDAIMEVRVQRQMSLLKNWMN